MSDRRQIIIKAYDKTIGRFDVSKTEADEIVDQLTNERAVHKYQSQLYDDNLIREADLNERY